MTTARTRTLLVLLAALAGCAGTGLPVPGGGPLDEATVAAGLREALRIGAGRAADRVGAPGGYLDSPTLHIPLPSALQDVAGALRGVGLGARVDELEVAMNRAAERGASEAASVLADAVSGLTLADAWSILRGHDTAATDHFRETTATALASRYRPIVEEKLRQVGGYAAYEELRGRLDALPLVDPPDLDLVGYVTDRALAGLFATLAQEERRIRADPLARTTNLLRRVFGTAD